MKIFSKSRDSSSDGGIFCYSRGQTNTTNFVVNNARFLKPGSRCIKSKIISERDVVSHKVNKHNTNILMEQTLAREWLSEHGHTVLHSEGLICDW